MPIQIYDGQMKTHCELPANCITSQIPQSPRTSSDRKSFTKFRKIGLPGFKLVYRLRQKESLGSVKQKIVRKIQQNESALCFEDLVREALEAV
jgi:hypothetical protein